MLTKATKNLLSLLSMFTLIVLTACQKDPGVDLDNPPSIPGEIKDSTFLIKSIVWVYNAGKDSLVEKYSYDTVNRKITLNWTDTYSDGILIGDQSEYQNTKAELSYNSKGLLIRVVYTYPVSYIPFEYDYDRIDITYDPDNIVQSIAAKYKGGTTITSTMNKTILPGGGYELKWSISDPDFPDYTTYRTAVFSNNGKNIVSVDDYRFKDTSPTGDTVEYKFIRTDSLAYDANDNVTKITTNFINERDSVTENYTSYEFTGRQTKGNQLYNQRKLILNGVNEMPFFENDDLSYGVGIMSFHFEYEYCQFSAFPAESAKVRMWDGSFKNFTSNPTYDSKNRLTKFTTFFVDNDLKPYEHRINYYK